MCLIVYLGLVVENVAVKVKGEMEITKAVPYVKKINESKLLTFYNVEQKTISENKLLKKVIHKKLLQEMKCKILRRKTIIN